MGFGIRKEGYIREVKNKLISLHIKQAWIMEKAAWTDGTGRTWKRYCMDVTEFFICL